MADQTRKRKSLPGGQTVDAAGSLNVVSMGGGG